MNQNVFSFSQSLMLGIAKTLLEKEATQVVTDRASHMAQNCPDLVIPHSAQELQVRHTLTQEHYFITSSKNHDGPPCLSEFNLSRENCYFPNKQMRFATP